MRNVPTGELWLPIEGWEDAYQVSDLGRSRSIDRVVAGRGHRGRLLKPYVDKAGRHQISLSKNAVVTKHLVAHLVAHAFLGPRPSGLVVRHWNDDPSDNRVSNLLYGTPSENMQDAIRNGHNFGANKTHCPRGHLLCAPNLVARDAGRTCLACARARTWVTRHAENFEAVADRYYAAIMRALPEVG